MSVCLYSCLSYPACKLLLICALSYIFFYDLFVSTLNSTLCHRRNDLRKKKGYEIVFLSSLQILSEIPLTLRKTSARYHYKCTTIFTYSTLDSPQIVIQNEFFRYVFEKPSNIHVE
jgi:hypothetical protein